MRPSATTRAFEVGEVAEQVFANLEWKDLLGASEVCTHWNDLVTSSSRLQITLREAYHDAEQCVVHADLSPAERLDRIIDVQRRWMALDPKRVELVPIPSSVSGKLSQGFMVTPEKSVVDDNSDVPVTNEDIDDHYYQQYTGWTVRDLTNLRDTPLSSAREWSVNLGFRFACLAISRQDNLIAIGRFQDLQVNECEVLFYLLDDGEDNEAPVPHPQAVPSGRLTAPVSCTDALILTLASGVVRVESCNMYGMWDWRAGIQTMPIIQSERVQCNSWRVPLRRTTFVTGAGHYEGNADYEHRVYFDRGDNERSRKLSFPFSSRRPEGSVGSFSRLLLIQSGGDDNFFNRSKKADSYKIVFRMGELEPRLWADSLAPPLPLNECGDIADLEFYEERDATSNLYGNGLLTVDMGNVATDGMFTHTLQMANYRFRSASSDAAHPWPLGSRHRQPPTSPISGGKSVSVTCDKMTVMLDGLRDWRHHSSRAHTEAFYGSGNKAAGWTSNRMGRPSVACQLRCPGNSVTLRVMDNERAIISFAKSHWRMVETEPNHFRRVNVSDAAYRGVLVLAF